MTCVSNVAKRIDDRAKVQKLEQNFNFFGHSAKKFSGGTIQCFRNIRVSKKLSIRSGYHYSPLKIICLTVPKKFVRKPLFQKNVVLKIFMHRREGGHHGIVEKSFVLQDRNEKLGKGTLVFQKISGIEKFLWVRGGGVSRFSIEFFFVSQYPKISQGNPSWFLKNSGLDTFEVKKMYVNAGIRTRTYRFRSLLSCPLCRWNDCKFRQKSMKS